MSATTNTNYLHPKFIKKKHNHPDHFYYHQVHKHQDHPQNHTEKRPENVKITIFIVKITPEPDLLDTM